MKLETLFAFVTAVVVANTSLVSSATRWCDPMNGHKGELVPGV